MNIYKEIFQALDKSKIEYLIIGGVAVNLYGYSRFTGDIDILLALDNENLKKMDNTMKKEGYTSRIPVDIKELGDKNILEKLVAEKGMKAYTFISNHRPQLNIDILVEDSCKYSEFEKNKTLISVWDVVLPVVSVNDLIEMKKIANREKDILDIEALLKLKDL